MTWHVQNGKMYLYKNTLRNDERNLTMKKKLFGILLVLCTFVCLLAVSANAATYNVAKATDFNQGTAADTYVLTGDIQVTAPLFNGAVFTGTLKGNGHYINLQISQTTDKAGLFAEIRGATIENVGFVGSVSGVNYVGAVAGVMNGGTITRVRNEGIVIKGSGNYVGGMVGCIRYATSSSVSASSLKNTYIRYCTSAGSTTITGAAYVGGMVGFLNIGSNADGKTVSIRNCVNNCPITSTIAGTSAVSAYVGGIVGAFVHSGTCQTDLYELYNEINGTVKASAKGQFAGGIIGYVRSENTAANASDSSGIKRVRIIMPLNRASVTGLTYVSGIVGAGGHSEGPYYLGWAYNSGVIKATETSGPHCAPIITAYAKSGVDTSVCRENYYFVRSSDAYNQADPIGDPVDSKYANYKASIAAASNYAEQIYVCPNDGPRFEKLHNPNSGEYCITGLTNADTVFNTFDYADHCTCYKNGTDDCCGCGKVQILNNRLYSAAHVRYVMNTPSYWDKELIVMNNIDMNNYDGGKYPRDEGDKYQNNDVLYNYGQTRIGIFSASPFTGTFRTKDNLDFTISNINIDGGTSSSVGFFGYLSGATVKNLTFSGKVSGTGSYYGGVVGMAGGGATISNCVNKVTVSTTGNLVGGFVGGSTNVTLTDCENRVNVSGGDLVGGFIGHHGRTSSTNYINGTAKLTNCINYNTVSGTNYVGGLIGGAVSSNSTNTVTITGCENQGKITGTGNGIGGLVGDIQGKAGSTQTATISGSTNKGTVSGVSFVGGLVGRNQFNNTGKLTVTDSKNQGTVSGADRVGGLTGRICGEDGAATVTVNISKFVNEKAVTASNAWIGGLLGECILKGAGSFTVTESKNHGAISGTYTVGGLFGKYETVADTTTATVSVTKCGNYGNVTCSAKYASSDVAAIGGIFGAVYHYNNNNAVFNTLYNEGNVTNNYGGNCNGGIIGFLVVDDGVTAGKNKISNIWNAGDVTTKSIGVGGIIGNMHSTAAYSGYFTMDNAYNEGKITSAGNVLEEAIAYNIRANATLTDCYYLTGTGTNDNSVATAVTADNYNKAETYPGYATSPVYEANSWLVTAYPGATGPELWYFHEHVYDAEGNCYCSVLDIPSITYGYSVVLRNDFLLEVLVRVPANNVSSAKNIELLFANGDTLDYAQVDEVTLNSVKYNVYRFEMPAIAAKEMNNSFEFIFRYENGDNLYAAPLKTANLVNYYDLAVVQDAPLVKVLNAMFNYGAAAQKFFDYDVDNLVNTNIPVADRVDEYTSYEATQQDSEGSDYGEHYFEVDSYTYVLGGKLLLKLNFKKVDDTCDVSNLIFAAKYETVRGDINQVIIDLSDTASYTVNGDIYTFELNISSANLRQVVAAGICTDDRTTLVSNVAKTNFECYAYKVFNNTAEANTALLQSVGVTATEAKITELKNLCQSLLDFSKVAADYFIELDSSES